MEHEKRIKALEDLVRRQGYLLQADGTWESKHVIDERIRMQQLCSDCGKKNKDCECDYCMGCGQKWIKNHDCY
jgi:hypothetical protein